MKGVVAQHYPPLKLFQRAQWCLVEPFEGVQHRVPAGFFFDGGSVPLLLSGFVSPTGWLFEPACIHDWCLADGMGWEESADAMDAEMQRWTPVWFRRPVMAAIRWYGRIKDKRGAR